MQRALSPRVDLTKMAKIFNVLPPGRRDPDGLAATMERIAAGQDAGSLPLAPGVSGENWVESQREAQGGLPGDRFRPVLEAHGFHWVPPHLVPANVPNVLRGIPHEGQWRHRGMKAAYAPSTLAGLFKGPHGPKELDRWIRERKLELRLQRRGTSKDEMRQAAAKLRKDLL